MGCENIPGSIICFLDTFKIYCSVSGVSKPPAFDRKQKPEYTRTDSLLAGSLRTVIVPQNTMEVFLKYAQSNTDKNVETCGILAGRLAQNQLFITHVIIPKQQGTADSCTTSNEEEIFDLQDQKSLITLGWIHVSYSPPMITTRTMCKDFVSSLYTLPDTSQSDGIPVFGGPAHALFLSDNDARSDSHSLCT